MKKLNEVFDEFGFICLVSIKRKITLYLIYLRASWCTMFHSFKYEVQIQLIVGPFKYVNKMRVHFLIWNFIALAHALSINLLLGDKFFSNLSVLSSNSTHPTHMLLLNEISTRVEVFLAKRLHACSYRI